MSQAQKPNPRDKVIIVVIFVVVAIVLIAALWVGKSALCALTGGHYRASDNTCIQE